MWIETPSVKVNMSSWSVCDSTKQISKTIQFFLLALKKWKGRKTVIWKRTAFWCNKNLQKQMAWKCYKLDDCVILNHGQRDRLAHTLWLSIDYFCFNAKLITFSATQPYPLPHISPSNFTEAFNIFHIIVYISVVVSLLSWNVLLLLWDECSQTQRHTKSQFYKVTNKRQKGSNALWIFL